MHEPRRLGLKLVCLVIGLLLVGPTLIVVPMSFTSARNFQFPPPGWSTQWFSELIEDPAWRESLFLSLQVGAVVTVLATVLGTAAAFGLVRGRGPWRSAVRAFVLAPMIVPGVITAIAIYYVFLNWQLSTTFLGFVLAHTIIAIPPVVVTVSSSLQSMDTRLERAAASLGAGPVVTFTHVTLPLILPGVLTGALFAFLMSFDEAIVSLFLSGPFVRTLPVQLYQSATSSITPAIAAASTLVIAFTTTLLLLAAVLVSRRGARHG